MMTIRSDQRRPDQLRPISFQPHFQMHPAGSVLVTFGKTRVICSVSVDPTVPRWKRSQGVPGGWITCEYRMLPGATDRRSARDGSSGPGGRAHEIQRLIGRSLRAIVDLEKLGERTLYIDCDVLDADGGTRCASICGATVALELALRKLANEGKLLEWPLREKVAAVSVGIVGGQPLLDLCYQEDSAAETDMNVVMTESGKFIEVQGTAEGAPFAEEELQQMLVLARRAMDEIFELQRNLIRSES